MLFYPVFMLVPEKRGHYLGHYFKRKKPAACNATGPKERKNIMALPR
jgi:hypothetical protein